MRLHHFPPSFSVMGLVQGKASEILLLLTHCCHEMIYFGTTDDLFRSQWRPVDDVHWWTFLLFFYMTQCFPHMTHSISILASSFSSLLFIFLKWLFIHSLTPIFVQPFFPSFPISILHSRALSFNWHSFLSCHITVGCIYASNPQYKSNIFQSLFNLFKPLSKHQNHSKIFFLNFLYFYWCLFMCHSNFYSTYCTKDCTFASTSRFDSELRKRLPACWLCYEICRIKCGKGTTKTIARCVLTNWNNWEGH